MKSRAGNQEADSMEEDTMSLTLQQCCDKGIKGVDMNDGLARRGFPLRKELGEKYNICGESGYKWGLERLNESKGSL